MRLEYFAMIDRVLEHDANGHSIRCEALVPEQSSIFEGHFPGHPLMPGVLLIESMAQASGFLALVLNRFTKMPFLAAVHEAKMRSFVAPGTRLEVSATLAYQGSGYVVTKTRIVSEGKRICDGELMLRVMAFPDSGFSAMMRERAAGLGIIIDL